MYILVHIVSPMLALFLFLTPNPVFDFFLPFLFFTATTVIPTLRF